MGVGEDGRVGDETTDDGHDGSGGFDNVDVCKSQRKRQSSDDNRAGEEEPRVLPPRPPRVEPKARRRPSTLASSAHKVGKRSKQIRDNDKDRIPVPPDHTRKNHKQQPNSNHSSKNNQLCEMRGWSVYEGGEGVGDGGMCGSSFWFLLWEERL